MTIICTLQTFTLHLPSVNRSVNSGVVGYIYIYIQFTCPMCTVSIHVYTIEDCTTGIALILVKDHFSLVHCNDILSTHKIMYVK